MAEYVKYRGLFVLALVVALMGSMVVSVPGCAKASGCLPLEWDCVWCQYYGGEWNSVTMICTYPDGTTKGAGDNGPMDVSIWLWVVLAVVVVAVVAVVWYEVRRGRRMRGGSTFGGRMNGFLIVGALAMAVAVGVGAALNPVQALAVLPNVVLCEWWDIPCHLGGVGQGFNDFFGGIGKGFSDFWSGIFGGFNDFWNGFFGGVTSWWSGIFGAFQTVCFVGAAIVVLVIVGYVVYCVVRSRRMGRDPEYRRQVNRDRDRGSSERKVAFKAWGQEREKVRETGKDVAGVVGKVGGAGGMV